MTSGDEPYRGRFEGGAHRFAQRVYFEDTDFSGVVYHASYLRFMERARSDLLALLGIDQRGGWAAGEGVYAVSEIAIRYKRPARFDDALTIVSTAKAVRAASSIIHQRVMRGDELLAEADVTAAYLSPEGRPRRQPRAWIDAFTRLLEQP